MTGTTKDGSDDGTEDGNENGTEDGTSEREYVTVGLDAPDYEQYAEVTLEEEHVLLYDRDDEEAWMKSDTAIDLAEAA